MAAALNNRELGDIFSAYVQAPVTEKAWTTLVPEFGKHARKSAVMIRALYGLKSTGTGFRSYFAKCMDSLGYKSCKTDLDLWLKPEIRPEDGV